MTARHDPLRPSWACDTCGLEWPCADARERMMTTWASVPRGLAMAASWAQAIEDLGDTKGLYLRFLGWVGGR